MPEKVEMNALPFIIAIDFDGTLVSDNFPHIGTPNESLIRFAKLWRKAGAKLVLWTCRNDERLLDAVAFCSSNGIQFDAINQNIPEVIQMFGGDTRKVYADVYIDDKAVLPDAIQRVTGGLIEYAARIPNNEQHNKVYQQS